MHSLRMSVKPGEDFVRVYNWHEGFRGDTDSLAMDAGLALHLALSGPSEYTVQVDQVEGDLRLTNTNRFGGDKCARCYDWTMSSCFHAGGRFIRLVSFYTVRWSKQARERGNGSGTIQLSSKWHPQDPMRINVTMGDFAYTPCATRKQCVDPTDRLSLQIKDALTVLPGKNRLDCRTDYHVEIAALNAHYREALPRVIEHLRRTYPDIEQAPVTA